MRGDKIQDRAVLESVDPERLLQYLSQRGWKKEITFNQLAEIWVLTDPETGSEYEILVPLTNEPKDYDLRISDVLEVLEVAEGRSQLAIIGELSDSAVDLPLENASRIAIRDKAVLESVPLSLLHEYLIRKGWRKRRRFNEFSEIWVKPDRENEDEYEILVPLTTKVRDYALRISDILKMLEVAEDRSKLVIVGDLLPRRDLSAERRSHDLVSLGNTNLPTEKDRGKKQLFNLESFRDLFPRRLDWIPLGALSLIILLSGFQGLALSSVVSTADFEVWALALAGAGALAWALALAWDWAGAWAWALALALAGAGALALAGAGALAGALALAGAGALALAGAGAWALAWAWAWAWALALAGALAWAGAGALAWAADHMSQFVSRSRIFLILFTTQIFGLAMGALLQQIIGIQIDLP